MNAFIVITLLYDEIGMVYLMISAQQTLVDYMTWICLTI